MMFYIVYYVEIENKVYIKKKYLCDMFKKAGFQVYVH